MAITTFFTILQQKHLKAFKSYALKKFKFQKTNLLQSNYILTAQL